MRVSSLFNVIILPAWLLRWSTALEDVELQFQFPQHGQTYSASLLSRFYASVHLQASPHRRTRQPDTALPRHYPGRSEVWANIWRANAPADCKAPLQRFRRRIPGHCEPYLPRLPKEHEGKVAEMGVQSVDRKRLYSFALTDDPWNDVDDIHRFLRKHPLPINDQVFFESVRGLRHGRNEWPKHIGILKHVDPLPVELGFKFFGEGLHPAGYENQHTRSVESWELQIILVSPSENRTQQRTASVAVPFPPITFQLAWGPVPVKHATSTLRTWPCSYPATTHDILGGQRTMRLSKVYTHDVTRYDRLLVEGSHLFQQPVPVDMYKLLGYMSSLFPNSNILEVGTHVGGGAFALASEPSNVVMTVDISNTIEEALLVRLNMTREDLQTAAPNVIFKCGYDLLKESTWRELNMHLHDFRLVHLDPAHLPYSVPFEIEFLKMIEEVGWKGILILDDIYINEEMTRWWTSLDSLAIPRYDVSSVGHWTGAGMIDFSGQLEITP
eukprot:TRINITY_DN42399_c0_g1_i5.p1 TRINITY_DN42399_c0_g1~~TRINITY_DN42399_c0_g1_i5.p1  ORF type:complete len:498 (+),score=24.57 TRINITY_DN42399_c0_g1_i5:129-1622(+)